MSRRNGFRPAGRLIGGALLLIGALGACSPEPRGGAEAVDGSWGAKGIGLIVDPDGNARVELDCAHGRLDGPLSLGNDGAFVWNGTFAFERPGPARSGDRDPVARYRGRIEGDAMTLRIESTSSDRSQGPFVLTRGLAPRIRKCS
ncbi:MAG: hypothetical protein ABI682_12360 [Acidobacteriota bacterium]